MTKQYRYLLLPFLWPLCLMAEPRTFEGTVSGKEGDELTIMYEDTWAPVPGDFVTIRADIAGRLLDAGTAEVLRVEDGRIVARVIGGNPNVQMAATVVSENPIPANQDPDTLYAEGFDLFSRAAGERDPLQWETLYGYDEALVEQALPLLEAAARQGHATAQYLTARIRYNGPKPLRDPEAFPELLEQAAEAGEPWACYALSEGLQLGMYGFSKDKERALDLLKKAADGGVAAAQYKMSYTIEVPKEERFRYFREAAAQEHPLAMENLGKIYAFRPYMEDLPVGTYFDEGIRLLEKAAASGLTSAMLELGDYYARFGSYQYPGYQDINQFNPEAKAAYRFWNNRKQEPALAESYFKQAVEKGDRAAYARLGLLYMKAGSAVFDPGLAIQYLTEGAEKKQSYCMTLLARIYREGKIVPGAPAKAFSYAQAAAENDLFTHHGSVELGLCYMTGTGTRRDYGRARELFEKGMQGRSGWGDLYLGKLYYNGWGVRKDRQRAYALYQQATEGMTVGLFGEEVLEIRATALIRMARMHLEADPGKAFSLSSRAVSILPDYGEGHRIFALSMLHKDYRNDQKLQSQGFKRMQRAAELGDMQSHYLLGELYEQGIGTRRDRKMARYHYQIAADAGIKRAQDKL